MKINLFLNDYRPVYNGEENKIGNHMPLALIQKIYRPEHQYILRGEPTEHPKIRELLDVFTAKNYILTTEVSQLKPLTGYRGEIPYISFSYDGFQNDQIRSGNRNLTNNVLKALEHFSKKQTIMRIEYVISPYNYEWFGVDLVIIKKMMNLYPAMKQPYFVTYHEGDFFKQKEFAWVPLTQDAINRANATGMLSQKNLDFLNAFIQKKEYACVAPSEELVVFADGSVRTCMSYRIDEILGNLNDSTLEEIIESSKTLRENCSSCQFRKSCFVAYHFKENIFQIEEAKRSAIETDANAIITT